MTTINRLLVANRGEIARRIFRTAKARGIATVAVYSDADAQLPFVREADLAVRLPGTASSDTYLNIEAIVAAAAASGADAIHPGYGFLAENAAFARASAAAGIVFVGPPPEAIEAMGSKLSAKQLMAAHGVPVLPGGVVTSAGDLAVIAADLGWPLLLKAAFGGGGRGMRALAGPDGAAEALESTSREAMSAFGDGTVFVERLLVSPRHVEVQVMADSHGTVVHLFERECSIQRRYQKVIEEAPSPAVGPELRTALGEAAVAAARAIGYVGAGTVEFVLDAEGRYFFLEVNTRLQVEHPVTEAVTGLDLVDLQLLVAEGEPLPDEVMSARMQGHAIEARLYAEDVGAGFLPVAGKLARFEIEPAEGLRVDAGVVSGSIIPPFYDAMFAKVIAWAPRREAAARQLARSLETARIHGVATNRDLLVGVLRHADFLAGRTDTGYLDRHDPAGLMGTPEVVTAAAHAAAAALAGQARRRAEATVQPAVPSGWRNVPALAQNSAFIDGDRELDVSYRLGAGGAADAWVGLRDAGGPATVEPVHVRVARATPDEVELEAGGLVVVVEASCEGDVWFLDSSLGHSSLREAPRFPPPSGLATAGSLLAPMPGLVTRVLTVVGERVDRGTVLMVIEAMKMEHPVRSPGDGIVAEVRVTLGTQVDAGALLVVIGPPE
jgi:acetyl/propionyl-CoA carboxylase alpha subunit